MEIDFVKSKFKHTKRIASGFLFGVSQRLKKTCKISRDT